jgi:hypothetical protein
MMHDPENIASKQTLNSNDAHLIGCLATKGDVFVLKAIHVSAIIWRALRPLAKHLENTSSSISR